MQVAVLIHALDVTGIKKCLKIS